MQNQALPDLRLAVTADAAMLSEIRRACFKEVWEEKTFSEMLSKPQYKIWVRDRVAFCIVQTIPPEAEIVTLAVAPSYRRRGIARDIIEHIWQYLGQEGIDTLHLEVNESLAPARVLYSKMGFITVGRRENYYIYQGKRPQDAILMLRKR